MQIAFDATVLVQGTVDLDMNHRRLEPHEIKGLEVVINQAVRGRFKGLHTMSVCGVVITNIRSKKNAVAPQECYGKQVAHNGLPL